MSVVRTHLEYTVSDIVYHGVHLTCNFYLVFRCLPLLSGPCGPYRQSERTTIYQKVAQELWDKGFAYPCFCTEEELEQKRQQVST